MATSAPRKAPALKEAMTKTQLVASLSEATGLPKKDVADHVVPNVSSNVVS